MATTTNGTAHPESPFPTDPDELVDIEIVKRALSVKANSTVYKLIRKKVLAPRVDWGLRHSRWRWADVLEARDKMRKGHQ